MNSKIFLVLSVLTFAAGCGGDSPVGGPDAGSQDVCGPGRACPRACEEGCATGEVCTGGYCAQPEPTSTSYSACAVDADCPRGDHCALGACVHRCISDRDCSGGEVCSNRGRCSPLAQVTEVPAPPAPGAPALAVTLREGGPATQLDFTGGTLRKTLVLSSTTGQPLEFRLLSSEAWLSAEPASGVVSGQPVEVTVITDPVAAGTDDRARLRINSTAGVADVDVRKERDLSGVFSGEVTIQTPFEVARSMLTLHLFHSATDTSITGYVEPDSSLLFPFRSGVTGSVQGDQVVLSFVVAGAPSSLVNPHYPRPIRRTVTLTATVTSEGLLAGTLTDALTGVLTGPGIEVGGSFRLRRMGPPVDGQAQPVPDLTFTPVQTPFTGTDRAGCYASCPSAKFGCSTVLGRAKSYLDAAAGFYRSFQAAASAQTNPHDAVVKANNTCGAYACLNETHLRCAQLLFDDALRDSSSDPTTKAESAKGLLDSYEVLADYNLLFGNDRVVSALESWRTAAATVSDEVEYIRSAHAFFTAGSHSKGTTQALAMLDPYALTMVLGPMVPADALRDTSSFLVEFLGDEALARGRFEHLRRQALVLSGALRARLEQADREHRLGRLSEATATARAGALQGYIDLMLLGKVMTKAGVTATELAEINVTLRNFHALSRKFDDLRAGRNPVGYVPDFVPFFAKDARTTNFEQIWSSTQVIADAAVKQQDNADDSYRTWEAGSASLSSQLTAQVLEYERQLGLLCGTTQVSLCGKAGSQLDIGYREINAAGTRLRLIQQRLVNIHEEVRIERDRARQSVGINEAEALLIMEDGRKLNALEAQEQEIQLAAEVFRAVGGIFGAIISGEPGAAFTAAANAQANLISITGQTQIDKARNNLNTRSRARVEFNQASEKLINSAALIQSRLLETATLAIELELAKESLSQALASVTATWRQARLLEAQQARLEEAKRVDAYRHLKFRVYSDALSLQALRSYRDLLEWAYLSTRALEYELNMSYGERHTLWQMRTAKEVTNVYLAALYQVYARGNGTNPQHAEKVISVRDRLLGLSTPLVDAVTGVTYSPRDRFRRFVANPANRDVNGDLHLSFMTFRPDDAMFSGNVCNDRIREVRVNLVGDSLGAGVTKAVVQLTQGGTSYMRSCEEPFELVAYNLLGAEQKPRVARVEAGLNAPNKAALLPNTDLQFRPLLAGPWELTIRSDEADNAGLDLRGLDDIEIILDHEANTLQR
jgi:hypothetical protein